MIEKVGCQQQKQTTMTTTDAKKDYLLALKGMTSLIYHSYNWSNI